MIARGRTEAALFAAAALIRLPGIGRPIIGDEGNAQVILQAPIGQTVDLLVRHDAHLPLYYVLLHAWSVVSGELWWLRLLSVLLGSAACVIVYRIGIETFGAWVGRAAFVVTALSPLLVFVSQYLRPYVLAVFLSSLAVLLATRLLRAERPRFLPLLAALTVCEALLLYTYYLSLFLVFAINAFLLVYLALKQRERVPAWAVSAAVLVLVCLPWLPYYSAQTSSVYRGTQSSTPMLKAAGMGVFVGPIQVGAVAKAGLALLQVDELRVSTMRASARWPSSVLLPAAAVAAAGLVVLIVAGWRRLHHAAPAAALLVVMTALTPVAAASALSIAGDLGVFHPVAVNVRYFGESAAVFALVLGAAAAAVRPRALAVGAAGVFALALVAQLPFIYAYPFNYQAEIRQILDRHPDVRVIVSSPATVDLFESVNGEDGSARPRYDRVVVDPAAVGDALHRIGDSTGLYFVNTTSAENMIQFPTFAADVETALVERGFVKGDEARVSDMLTIAVFTRKVPAGS